METLWSEDDSPEEQGLLAPHALQEGREGLFMSIQSGHSQLPAGVLFSIKGSFEELLEIDMAEDTDSDFSTSPETDFLTLPDCKMGSEADEAARDGLAKNEEEEEEEERGIELFSTTPAVNDATLANSKPSVARETILAPDTEGDTIDRDGEGDTVASDSEDRLTASFMPPLGGCMEGGGAVVPDNEDRLTASFTPPMGGAVNGPWAIRPALLESILVWETIFGARLIAKPLWAGIPSETLLFDARLPLLPSL